MTSFSRFGFLKTVAAISAVAFLAVATCLYLVYAAARQREIRSLQSAVETTAAFMESIARNEMEREPALAPETRREAVLKLIASALVPPPGRPVQGVLMIGQRHGNVVDMMQATSDRGFVLAARIFYTGVEAPPPMVAALDGQHGTMELQDYRRIPVLAAYAPVAALSLGLVYKIDRSEIQEPFLRAAAWAAGIYLAMVGLLAAGQRLLSAQLEKRLAASEQRMASIFAHSPVLMFTLASDATIERVNPAFERLSGWQAGEVRGRDWFTTFLPAGEREAAQRRFQAQAGNTAIMESQSRILTRDGAERIIDWHVQAMRDERGVATGQLHVGTDVTERVQAEEAVRHSLRDKEMLLREVHHRVKNNLQIISSLLHFQRKKNRDPSASADFDDIRGRLRAMTLVHEKLYRATDLSRVDFSDYLSTLVHEIAKSYNTRGNVAVRMELAPLTLRIEQATPCGMLISELLTNAFKYAFPDGRPGRIDVRAETAGARVTLTVQDNGTGLPNGFDPVQADSFGWRLVHALAGQLAGTVAVANHGGTTATLSFPLSAQET